MPASILKVWGCLDEAEEAACRSMANAYRAGINRPASVIEGFFFTLLPAGHHIYRIVAWEANFRMAQVFIGDKDTGQYYYRPNRIWCQVLGDAFTAGTVLQNPTKCQKLTFVTPA